MIKREDRNTKRVKRHQRIRGKLSGTAERPRFAVYRSLQNIYVQIIDDTAGKTLVAAASTEKDFGDAGGNRDAAKKVGELAARRAIEKGITNVVFDRGGYIYHGRVQSLAEGAREAGLKF